MEQGRVELLPVNEDVISGRVHSELTFARNNNLVLRRRVAGTIGFFGVGDGADPCLILKQTLSIAAF